MNAIHPDRETFLKQARSYRLLSLQTRMTADLVTPIALFREFDDQQSAFLLESVHGGAHWGRHSIMGRHPLMQLQIKRRRLTFQLGNEAPQALSQEDPLEFLRQTLQSYAMPPDDALPYRCALTGYFAYDFCRLLEKLPDGNPDELDLPDVSLIAPREVLIFDHLKNELILLVNCLVSEDPCADYESAKDALHRLAASLGSMNGASKHSISHGQALANEPLKADAARERREAFLGNVEKVKQHIHRGDVFQTVLSMRFSAPCQHEPLAVYRALRTINPSPYLFFVRQAGAVLVGSSPEMLARLQHGRIETCPIAGTRKRGSDEASDRLLETQLKSDEKELAEHAMLVDLARNDVGRISKIGSVKVENYGNVERFSHVMHLVSLVTGQKEPSASAVDVLASVLPAGTLSGAPKIRAMQIIDELEEVRRGPYGGAVGYLGFDGNMDTCITIRTAVLANDAIHVQAGAGIVADSDPEKEYEEVRHKAHALFAAIQQAGGYA